MCEMWPVNASFMSICQRQFYCYYFGRRSSESLPLPYFRNVSSPCFLSTKILTFFGVLNFQFPAEVRFTQPYSKPSVCNHATCVDH